MAEDGKVTIAVFLDFKRAFETIDRDLLLKKMEKYGFSDASRKLLGSFLKDRKQYVYANEDKSNEINVNIGIAQGSVLGPLLFILYINDLPSHLKNVLVKIFADDTLLAVSAFSYKEAAKIMNRKLEIVSAWLKIFKVKLNVSKSKFMVIAKSRNKITSLQQDIEAQPIKVENEVLCRVEVYKYLGVMIDCCLKFDEHVSYIIKKIGKKAMYLGRIKNKLSMSSKKLIYNCIIAPHFDYCSTVMWKISEENMQKLQKLQNIAMRYILKCKRSTSSSVLLRKTA
jgi:ribonucleases P/MRP protein subunit RPP40